MYHKFDVTRNFFFEKCEIQEFGGNKPLLGFCASVLLGISVSYTVLFYVIFAPPELVKLYYLLAFCTLVGDAPKSRMIITLSVHKNILRS
jgi:hypothetical protein